MVQAGIFQAQCLRSSIFSLSTVPVDNISNPKTEAKPTQRLLLKKFTISAMLKLKIFLFTHWCDL